MRTRALPAAAMGALVVLGMASIVCSWIDAGRTYPWRAAGMFAAATVAMFNVADVHPFPRFGPANQLTLIRLMLLSVIAGLIGEPASRAVAYVGASLSGVIAALDGLDGWVARRHRVASPFGARFDMETDALLVLVLSILVWLHDKAGAWVLVGGLLRYAFWAAGCVLPWMSRPLTPTRRAKTIAITHVVGLTAALAPVVPVPVSSIVAGATTAALSWSFSVDVRRLRREEP